MSLRACKKDNTRVTKQLFTCRLEGLGRLQLASRVQGLPACPQCQSRPTYPSRGRVPMTGNVNLLVGSPMTRSSSRSEPDCLKLLWPERGSLVW